MKPFWRAYCPWFAARGLHLFEPLPNDNGRGYTLPPPTTCPPDLPYATYGDIELDTSLQIVPPPKFAPARDSCMRDVMIKLVKKGSEEHRIYEDLLLCSELSGPDFQGILPPVAILGSEHDFSFVVMPRWGDCAPLHGFETVSGVLNLMRCLLKDIDFHNIMVNYYVFGLYREKFYQALEAHRRRPDALHCLMDFDRSLKLPLSTSLDTCRRPAGESLVTGTPYQPSDLDLAEHDYNPFAFDVGCLGNMFRISYADLVPIVPMLAPLFDQMTTHVISERFKAADALAFLEDATRALPGDVLCAPVQVKSNWDCLEDANVYWAKLPADFCATPGLYRTPPLSLARRLLSAIARYRIGWRILLFLRSVLRV
uniref:N/A n=1 Tax=Ganoderma boninense TaxID=34458 RepID=A0A5K1JZ50_9APHY|nr:N/A [Ganoderma boninense]